MYSRDFNLRVERVQKFLIREANISNPDPVTLLFFQMQKLIRQQNWNACAKLRSGNFPTRKFQFFFYLSAIYPVEFFLVFPVSSSVCNKKIFTKKIWGHRLGF